MTVTTRTAPAGARLMHAFATAKASPSQPLRLQVAGQVLQFATAAEMTAAIRRLEASGTASEPAPVQTDPAPAAPNTAPDTAARLDAQDAQLQDHETRIAALEERSPAPGLNDGAANAPAESSAVAAAASPLMVDGRAIYARMNARSVGPEAAATPPMPAMVQTSSGPVINASAIYARHNALAAARAGRPHARARG